MYMVRNVGKRPLWHVRQAKSNQRFGCPSKEIPVNTQRHSDDSSVAL